MQRLYKNPDYELHTIFIIGFNKISRHIAKIDALPAIELRGFWIQTVTAGFARLTSASINGQRPAHIIMVSQPNLFGHPLISPFF